MAESQECFLCGEDLKRTPEGDDEGIRTSSEENKTPNFKQPKEQGSQTLIRLFGFLHRYGYGDEKNASRTKAGDAKLVQSVIKHLQSVNYCKICIVKVEQVAGVFKLYDNLGQKLEGYKNEIMGGLSACSSGFDERNSKLRNEIIAGFADTPANNSRRRCPSRPSTSSRNYQASQSENPVVQLRRLEEDPALVLHYQSLGLQPHYHRISIKREPEPEPVLDDDHEYDPGIDEDFIGPDIESDSEYAPSSPKKKKIRSGSGSRKKTDKAKPRIRKKKSSKRTAQRASKSTATSTQGQGFSHSLIDVLGVKVNRGGRPLRACQPVFPCDFEGCDFRGQTEVAAQEHLQEIHPEAPRPHICADPVCVAADVSFISEERLARHKHWAHSEFPYPCQDCDFACKRKETMKIHRFRVHGVGGQRCPYEGCTYIGPPGGVRLHLESSVHQDKGHGERKHMCQHCGKTFISPQQLKYHLNSRHPELVSDPGELERYRCEHCGKLSCSPFELKKHIKAVHLRQFDIHCEVCGKGVSNNSQLRKHMRAHLQPDEFEFACEVCHAKFRQKGRMTVHMKRHTGELNYCCGQCDKKFIDSSALRRHERIHAGVLKYVCHICNKGFPVLDYLRTHLISHGTPEEKKAVKERRRQNKAEFPVLNRIYNDLRKQGSNLATVPADPNLKAAIGEVPAYPMHYDYRRQRKPISRVLEPEELVGVNEVSK